MLRRSAIVPSSPRMARKALPRVSVSSTKNSSTRAAHPSPRSANRAEVSCRARAPKVRRGRRQGAALQSRRAGRRRHRVAEKFRRPLTDHLVGRRPRLRASRPSRRLFGLVPCLERRPALTESLVKSGSTQISRAGTCRIRTSRLRGKPARVRLKRPRRSSPNFEGKTFRPSSSTSRTTIPLSRSSLRKGSDSTTRASSPCP